ncbi:hypothetical protein BDQ12DRAFT_715407 [Crucibulum laeve]|uniref:Uncharacterized protein n=1 Tax=Crucibulum laeve TaxID=68775 RepID=A0A5C3LM62_9AGAR|nr:hypothetical protein BDQ12DRAFT_715407 [Crucibulum laeve]
MTTVGQNQRESTGYNSPTNSRGTNGASVKNQGTYSAHSASNSCGNNTESSGGMYNHKSSENWGSHRHATGYADPSGPGSAYASSTTASAHATGPIGSRVSTLTGSSFVTTEFAAPQSRRMKGMKEMISKSIQKTSFVANWDLILKGGYRRNLISY